MSADAASADAVRDGRPASQEAAPGGALDFLGGGGEMARLIRTKNWAETPLGPIESWPQSLRTAVSLCVASNFPISIAWGPKHIQIYNDGYWPICGVKHPLSMGQDYSECWASAWPAIGDAFEKGYAGEASYLEDQRMFLDRKGFLEETFFTFSFSPIRDESGKVGGLFHPVTEQTARILSERRVEMLRDLAQRAGSARTTGEVYAQAMELFARHALDLPFVLLYRLEEDGNAAALIAQTGLPPGTPVSPLRCDLAGPGACWPIAEAARGKTIMQLVGIDIWFGDLPCGPYPELPRAAFLLPVVVPGSDMAAAVLVVGASARLQLDEAYRGFFSLLASSMSSCVANARNYEDESRRAASLAELDRAKTAFFSNISHEFRTPLALILAPLDDVLAGNLSAAQAEALGIVRRNAQRLLKLVNTVLDFSRLEANRTSAAAEPTNLALATAEHASGFRPVCEQAGITLTVECDAALDAVYVDRDMWEKITLNLLSNAFKFTFAGEISVLLRAAGDDIELTVRDTGTGIPAASLPHIFERFNRVEGAHGRTHEGSGIGLALVHELVRLQGGAVTVESELGVGSVFRVTMPRRNASSTGGEAAGAMRAGAMQAGAMQAAAMQAGEMTARTRSFVDEAALWLPDQPLQAGGAVPEISARDGLVISPVLPASPATIVLADDNADMRAYITRILTEAGMVVRATADGEAALRAIRHAPMAELVLSDVMMPRLDGFGLLREIRGDSALSHLPVVMLSARAGEEASVEGLNAGADDYLVKPFSARELVARVRGNLEMARMRKRLIEREKFALVVEAAPAALLLVAPSGLIEMANRAAERLFDYPPGAMEHMRLDRRIPEAFLAAADGSELASCWGREVFGLRQDGSEVPLEVSFNPIEVDGQKMQLIAIIDVTERRMVETEKANKALGLERSNQDLEAFAYIASHDLKAPLRAITHLAEWIAEEIEPSASPKALEYLQTLVGRTTRLRVLLDGLLAYSRVGRDVLRQEEVDVAALVSDILAVSPPPPGFTVQCERTLPRLHSYHTPLRVVLDNLISNSLKHHDRETGHVEISMRLENGIAEFRVSDDGPGISPKFHKRIFEIFRTLASRDAVESSGMGLAIVKKMVEVHGGAIHVESMAPIRGTTFVFTWKEIPR
jgi:PAS domain S-box-containing protein